MKSMDNDDLFTFIKSGFADELEKVGSSLEEFETQLANTETDEGQTKVAGILSTIFGKLLGGVGATAVRIPGMAAEGALATGVAGGAGAYGLGRHLDEQDKSLDAKREEMRRIKTMTEQLKSDYGIN